MADVAEPSPERRAAEQELARMRRHLLWEFVGLIGLVLGGVSALLDLPWPLTLAGFLLAGAAYVASRRVSRGRGRDRLSDDS